MLKKVLAAAVFVGAVFYFIVDPDVTPCLICPFEYLTGLKCPGCGSQRALHHLLHFEIGDALRDNAFLVISVPLLLLIYFANRHGNRFPGLKRALYGKTFRTVIISALALWSVGRNLPL